MNPIEQEQEHLNILRTWAFPEEEAGNFDRTFEKALKMSGRLEKLGWKDRARKYENLAMDVEEGTD